MRLYPIIFYLLLLLLSTTSHSDPHTSFSFYSSLNFAGAHGYVQIPAGGQPGSSSVKRPTLSELGITHTVMYKLGVTHKIFSQFAGYGEYQGLNDTAAQRTTQDLMTHGIPIAAGSLMQTTVGLNNFRLGINYAKDSQNNFELMPTLELDAVSILYKIKTSNVNSSRHFTALSDGFGLKGSYFFSPTVYLDAELTASIPKITNLQFQRCNVDLNFPVINSNHVAVTVYSGISYQRFHFKDKQPMPNDVNVIFAPGLDLGFKIFSS